MKRKIMLLIAVLLFSATSFPQLDKFSQRVGVSLKASTNGLGGDIFYEHSKKLAVKVGAEYISINLSSNRIERFINNDPNITIKNPYGSDIVFNAEGKFRTGAISLSAGYQFSKHFYVTAGLSKSLFASKATGLPSTDAVFEMEDLPFIGTVEATIYKEDIGPFIIDVDSRNSITPYVGIGLGSYVPQNKKISFALELGTYYIGEFVLEHTMPKGISTNNINYNSRVTEAISVLLSEYIEAAIDQLVTNLDKEVGMVVDDINSALKGYQFYPVIKLTIGFNLSSF